MIRSPASPIPSAAHSAVGSQASAAVYPALGAVSQASVAACQASAAVYPALGAVSQASAEDFPAASQAACPVGSPVATD